MDMAELHKIQTDLGTQFSNGQDTKFVNQNTLTEKCCKRGYNTPTYQSIFKTPVHRFCDIFAV